eukprot:scaffold136181_cov21-Tisochrysis_lutea.AAC.1
MESDSMRQHAARRGAHAWMRSMSNRHASSTHGPQGKRNAAPRLSCAAMCWARGGFIMSDEGCAGFVVVLATLHLSACTRATRKRTHQIPLVCPVLAWVDSSKLSWSRISTFRGIWASDGAARSKEVASRACNSRRTLDGCFMA